MRNTRRKHGHGAGSIKLKCERGEICRNKTDISEPVLAVALEQISTSEEKLIITLALKKFPFDTPTLDGHLSVRFRRERRRQTRRRWRAQEGWKHPTRRDSVSVLIYKNSPRTPNLPS